ncbi:RNA methyltransferase, TrmH family [Pseudonocardia thermophila]|jgi:rRNA methylases|uniref:RNA methyltransferase, TrmH family n=1 Tax=Pseudonocardia thermophila TaxID=1848 RepID=A0A1M6RMA6_PSETH|nr:TrmH family RNA methyltransferase [Pseudonocardia thermophila]SHK33559.1 RNA methyltransferase, TrmH family [Pseudonocardia thermophila]
MPGLRPVTSRNAAFQQWQALLTNRTKRHRTRGFLVQGVRPITMALRHGWQVDAVLVRAGKRSSWAAELLRDTAAATHYELAPELIAELGEKEEQVPEALLVVRTPPDDLDRIPTPVDALVVAFDRPSSPGNLGTLVRSADALGAHGVIVTGHAADLYDPRTVRATTGSLFGLPAVRADGPDTVMAWVERVRAAGVPLQVVGTDENAPDELAATDLTGPVLLVVGNETSGMSTTWAAACDHLTRIPMAGTASSLNAAVSGSIALYEAARQRAALPAR